VGQTASLLAAGLLVILLGIAIPNPIARVLEFLVALMIIFLGGRILYLTLRHRQHVHVHTHSHEGHTHTHFHFHDESDAHAVSNQPEHAPEHHPRRLSGWRPVIVGMITGLQGWAGLTLLSLIPFYNLILKSTHNYESILPY
jgi:ABC-type nickel/cobalt efflux system permease component RcnA